VKVALDAGFDVSVGAEDASRADPDFLVKVAEAASAAGARRLRFADTLGVLDPLATSRHIRGLCAAVDIEIEMHAHDDFGLATANTLAAVLAGATHINTTVNGLGERAGNAALEEAVMALRHLYDAETGIDAQHFPQLSSLVARASGRAVAVNKSIVGEAVFTHEAGIHVDGLIKNPLNYQGFDPLEVGREHRLVLGKHSGSRSVVHAYAKLGIALSQEQARDILARIRIHAMANKCSPDGNDLERFYLESATQDVAHS
jgi:homocitrate synthase NifV